jgi:hypothetical protein
MSSRRLLLAGAATITVALSACSSGSNASPANHSASATAPTTTAPASTVPPSTTTTVDPGSLPQTTQLPSSDDPLFRARVANLWQAITTGNVALAAPAFFPLSAYIQVKAISDPTHDYQTRLIANYDQDILTLHSELGSQASSAVLTGVTVPNAAVWVVPGVEDNRGSYWRVYGTELSYQVNGQTGSFEIHSMISWRGEWYVVHLGPIR